jgi:acetyltransferase-like isoleucine patch superfamily enzyme
MNAKVWDGAVVEAGVVTGDGCVIGSCAFVGQYTVMGDNVRIQHGAFIARGSTIGNNVFIGPGAKLIDDTYPRAGQPYKPNPPTLEDGCSIGAGAIIMPGVRIGKGVLIGAGAVVVASIEEGVWAGVPARSLSRQQ